MAAANNYVTFLHETLAALFNRRMLWPALALTVLLTATNIVILHNMPPPRGGTLPPLFIAAATVRIVGLLVLSVAITRILAASPRSPWMPDGSFWLAALLAVPLFGISLAIEAALGGRTDALGYAIAGILRSMIVAPFVPWFVALTAARPLAWSPLPWLRRFGSWLGPVIAWTILLVVPLGYVHAAVGAAAVEGRLDHFWPVMLSDGPLSALIVLLSLGLDVTAYRRVARGDRPVIAAPTTQSKRIEPDRWPATANIKTSCIGRALRTRSARTCFPSSAAKSPWRRRWGCPIRT